MKENIARRSKLQGFSKSRLPEFTKEEKAYLKGTHDYLGVNSYTSSVVIPWTNYSIDDLSWEADSGTKAYQLQEWPDSASAWLKVLQFLLITWKLHYFDSKLNFEFLLIKSTWIILLFFAQNGIIHNAALLIGTIWIFSTFTWIHCFEFWVSEFVNSSKYKKYPQGSCEIFVCDHNVNCSRLLSKNCTIFFR